MLYCKQCAEKYVMSTDSYFLVQGAGGQCEICSKGGRVFSKWIGINKIRSIIMQIQLQETTKQVKDFKEIVGG